MELTHAMANVERRLRLHYVTAGDGHRNAFCVVGPGVDAGIRCCSYVLPFGALRSGPCDPSRAVSRAGRARPGVSWAVWWLTGRR